MGYNYYLRIATEENIDNETLESINNTYNSLRDDGWNIEFDICKHTSSRGYGTGPDNEFSKNITILTNKFPDISFLVYFFYWDLTHLTVLRVRGSNVDEIFYKSYEDIDIPGGLVGAVFDPETFSVDNELIFSSS